MRSFRNKKVKDWARLAAKLGLLLSEPKVRAAMGDALKDGAERVSDTVADKYADTVERLEDRLEAAGNVLRRRRTWPQQTFSFLLGIGVGAGVGLLLAPATGGETRDAIREKAADLKDKVVDTAATARGKFRRSVANMPATGTEG